MTFKPLNNRSLLSVHVKKIKFSAFIFASNIFFKCSTAQSRQTQTVYHYDQHYDQHRKTKVLVWWWNPVIFLMCCYTAAEYRTGTQKNTQKLGFDARSAQTTVFFPHCEVRRPQNHSHCLTAPVFWYYWWNISDGHFHNSVPYGFIIRFYSCCFC